MSHHTTEDEGNPVSAGELAQINVNTIAINNNASNLATANTNISTNATNITTANNAISSNDTDITSINNNLATITTNVSNNASAITTNGNSITTLNTTTATNTTNIATNLATNNTQTTNIATNATNIGTNDTDIATNATNIATNATNIATNIATNNTQNTNIATNATNIATNLATNNTQTTNIATNATNIATNTTNIATNVSNIATNSTELGNITIGSSQLIYKKWRIGEVGTQAYLQHTDLNSGILASQVCSMRVLDDGDMRLNAPTLKNIQFRINDVEQIRIEQGIFKLDNDGDIRMYITAPDTNTALFFVGGNSSQGTSRLNWGQAHTNGIPTYGGGIIYNGDDSPNISAPQDFTMMVNYSNSVETNVLGYSFADDYLRIYRSLRNENYKENFYSAFAEPKLIGQTMISSSAMTAHRMSYNGSTATNNTWYMPHPSFRVVCRTPLGVSRAEYVVSFTTDGYYSGRNVYVCLSSSSSASNILSKTITLIHGRNSDWTTRIHRVSMIDTSLTPNATNIRYVFVKEVAVASSGAVLSAGGNQGWVLFGGHNTHNGTSSTQNTHYYESALLGSSPFGATQPLICKCFSIPSNAFTSTSSNTVSLYQFIGF